MKLFNPNTMKLLDPNYDLYFEPVEPIINSNDFTNELFRYANNENINLVIIEESMEPLIRIDNIKYSCKLGEPYGGMKKLYKMPILSLPFEYKWVYIYKID
ncbi:hypothetical protein SAMN02745163_01804 [Clostridium cavendishii DSM 21758]|uniref:Uncharacterized protein n=1 Tax=Clostridium cavendishii DSM 21758 TaxID=1121302 RepID=A0A1M6ISD2_9CLOT|nr:hypothetical protein [Clostridium cavendishii]SHJ37393.1 hypothetical protein SAMN02745163_01804 [Clostridium cavendishii DSM 21758]